MRLIRNGGVGIAARLDGPAEGPVVAFANSLGTDHRVFDALVARLPRHLRILRYDKRGHGLSDVPPPPYQMAEHVADLAALAEAFALPPFLLVGLSIGGAIAQGFAAAHPERLSGLVLIDTAPRIGHQAMWDARIARVEAGGMAAIAGEMMLRWFSPAFLAAEPDTVALYRNMLCRVPPAGYVGCCRSLRDADHGATTPALRLPALVVCGTLDKALPPADVAAMAAAMPDARYLPVEGSGHFPCVEQPDVVAAAIIAFAGERGLF